MLINTFLDTEDFVHLYYEEEPVGGAQGCGAGARMASKLPQRPPSPSPTYTQLPAASSDMTDGRERCRAPPPPEPPPHRVRAADMYPRLRTHYDEPGLDFGFTPICGEFVQWVGRTADGGTVAMSNYRLHAQPRRRSGPGASVPLRLIDAVEIRDLLHLVILCKHGRQLKCSFNTGEQCVEWWRRLNTALAPLGSVQETFAAAYAAWAKDQPPASVHRALMRASIAPQRHWFGPELERLGFTSKDAWRVTAANAEYKLCSSYPPLLVVPATIGDEDLDSVARFRAMRRVPAVVWRHRGNGAVIARSSQPEVGWLGWRSSEDERLLAAFVTACTADRGLQPANTNKQIKLLIVDARSYASAVTNRARGGGCECQQYYPNADIQFMSLPNIHHVRRSFQQMRALTAEPSDQTNWHSNLERTLWLQYVSGVLRASCVVARAVLAGRPALVHCSDGWDRTPQIVAAAQLILDPHYRTLEGFRILVEREWLDFGHKFADRCGHQFGPEDPNERSPIFLQWLDAVHQLMVQYPSSFEFNEAYLIKMATHVHSCMFGTFLCNTSRERIALRVPDTTAQVWQLLRAPAYRNHLYSPHHLEQVLWPECGVRYLRVWWAMFSSEQPDDDARPAAIAKPTANGLMTKTRSCDNLLNEAEKRTTQRRCSDPSLAPDVMKLSTLMNSEKECRSALTDSCVDDLPVLPVSVDNCGDQVDLHPDHFETPSPLLPRDLTSGSSSLERELRTAVDNDDVPPLQLADIPPLPLRDSTPVSDVEDRSDMVDSVIRVTSEVGNIASDVDTPEEPPEFVCDTFGDVVGMAEVGTDIPLLPLGDETSQPPVDVPALPLRDATPVSEVEDRSHVVDGVINVTSEVGYVGSAVGTPEEPSDFVCDTFRDVVGMAEAARESGRTRNISITWRSISESSNQSSTGFDIGDAPQKLVETAVRSRESSPMDNHNSTDGDLANHNVTDQNGLTTSANLMASVSELTNHNRENGLSNGVNGIASQFLEVDLNGGATSSSLSSESEGEAGGGLRRRGGRGARVASQLTLCPPSPRRPACCHCSRRASATSGTSTSGSAGSRAECWCGVCGAAVGASRVRCVCGAGAGAGGAGADALDGLPPHADPLQDRLHQIILYQKKVVEELSGQLRSAREALRQASPGAAPRAPPSAPLASQMSRSSGSVGAAAACSGSGSGSSSGSQSEVEVGEEARGVVWLPDAAAPRCQHCSNHFWLARRRHHCRRCGGIFCGSCSEMSSWGDCSVRMCRRCRAQR